MIHIYYGFGKGKTCSAIGAGMRSFGAGKSVCLVQFFKNNKSSELKSTPFDCFKAPDSLSFNPDSSYQPWVDSAIDYVKGSNCDVIILDELMDLIPDFLSVNEVLSLFDENKEYIITGHKPVSELLAVADYVTRFEKEKHPFDKGVVAREGIEY